MLTSLMDNDLRPYGRTAVAGIARDLRRAFVWSGTAQGRAYWQDVHDRFVMVSEGGTPCLSNAVQPNPAAPFGHVTHFVRDAVEYLSQRMMGDFSWGLGLEYRSVNLDEGHNYGVEQRVYWSGVHSRLVQLGADLRLSRRAHEQAFLLGQLDNPRDLLPTTEEAQNA